MTGRSRPIVAGLLLWAALDVPPAAHAVGLDGPEGVDRRLTVSVGAGADRVSGYGQDTYPFVEASVSGEALVWKRLVVGAAFTARQDLDDYNDALGRWQGDRSPGIAAQVLLGYDGPAFHVSLGPWLYGSKRDRPEFRAAILPYGVLRLRFGHLDRWHFNVRIADGAPFTAEGAGLGVRLMVAAPPWRRHRPSAGLYTSIGEKTLGLALTDELAGAGPRGTALRWGALLGTDLERVGRRPELAGFVGLVW